MKGMETGVRTEPVAETRSDRSWWEWHESHPTFAALAGFFAGMLFVTALPGAFAGILRRAFDYETAEKLFPLVLGFLAVPIGMLMKRRTRRFAQFMWVGMVVTALVFVGVTSVVLYFMVRYDA
jgi:hypothetical protein